MRRFDLVKKSVIQSSGKLKVGTIDLANIEAVKLTGGVPYMLVPQIDPTTGEVFDISLERAEEKSFDTNVLEAAMDQMAQEIEEDAWIVLQSQIGSISFEEANAQRNALHEKRRAKIREEERAKAKAELLKFMEGL